jgi:hypothetical protein
MKNKLRQSLQRQEKEEELGKWFLILMSFLEYPSKTKPILLN